ncbi:MAG: ATP phosphoribosyltransferase [Oligosphaeraceae bacterium]|nr:ATP phosphoribosyltransferase [Oligosphaeraceae bacterium]
MLKIALPNKGTLSDESVLLVKEAGYKVRREGRELLVSDTANDVEFLFLRPRDIAVYVANGIVDLGVTGRDLLLDSGAHAVELSTLGFGKSRFCYAVPGDSTLQPENFQGLRIATSYPSIVAADMQKRGLEVKIVKLDGAVEISVQLGVADAIADVVESGSTLRQAGLKIVGAPVLYSEALLIARTARTTEIPQALTFLRRVEGIVVARQYLMVEYDVPADILERACSITPGLESPTVAPLSKEGWFAVKAMVEREGLNQIIDSLEEAGARGIIVSDIRTCRI